MNFTPLGKSQHSFWLAKLDNPSFVYIVQAVQAGHEHAFKVGVATDVEKRRLTLQTGHPYELWIQQVIPGAHELEGELHHMLKRHRLYGEWFRPEGAAEFFSFFTEVERALRAAWTVEVGVPDFREVYPGPWRVKERNTRKSRNWRMAA
jgi:Meiotically Up-regulated Gene 113 (MUG113) protein